MVRHPTPGVASFEALASESADVPLALADVVFNGKLTTSTGKDRVFTTPELTPGKTYTYTVTANWT
jgi:uncharacterized protein (TIGR03000 family)